VSHFWGSVHFHRGRLESTGCGPQGAKLSDLLASVDSAAGRARLEAYLETSPFPHFRAVPGREGFLEKIEADGTREVGRFVRRKWRVADSRR